MTFNTLYLSSHYQDLVNYVDQVQPDIIAMQEANPILASRLKREASAWPYSEYTFVRINGRIALFSKFPIQSIDADEEWLGCHCAQALINWQGKTIRIIVVHIRAPTYVPSVTAGLPSVKGFDASAQAHSFAALRSQIASSREPLIILGDFNTTEREAGYRSLYAAGLKDAHQEAGWGFGMTFPAPYGRYPWLPISLIRIDHVFFNDDWRATQSWTVPLMESDHQALLADLRWAGGK